MKICSASKNNIKQNNCFNSKDELIVPYININSEYANTANNEIKEIETKFYKLLKTAVTDNNVRY